MKKQRFEWKKFHPAFLAFLFYHVEQSYYRLYKQQLAPRKGAATDSFIFPIPLLSIAVTIDEISPGDKRARGGEGWNKCREKDRLTACAPLEEPRGKRMKNIFQSVPFCLTPRPLAFLPSFSFLLIPLLSLSWLSRGRNRVEIYPSWPRKKRPTFLESPFSFLSWKVPSMGWTDQVKRGGKSNFFRRLIEAILSGFWICLFTRYNAYLRTWCFILYRYCAIVIYSQWRGIRFFLEIEILSFKYIKDEDTHNSVQ